MVRIHCPMHKGSATRSPTDRRSSHIELLVTIVSHVGHNVNNMFKRVLKLIEQENNKEAFWCFQKRGGCKLCLQDGKNWQKCQGRVLLHFATLEQICSKYDSGLDGGRMCTSTLTLARDTCQLQFIFFIHPFPSLSSLLFLFPSVPLPSFSLLTFFHIFLL